MILLVPGVSKGNVQAFTSGDKKKKVCWTLLVVGLASLVNAGLNASAAAAAAVFCSSGLPLLLVKVKQQ